MRWGLLFVICTVMIISLANAENCQCIGKFVIGTETRSLPYTLSGIPLQEVEIKVTDAWGVPFTVTNNNSVDLKVYLRSTVVADGTTACIGNETATSDTRPYNISISANSTRTFEVFGINNNPNCRNYKFTEVNVVEYYSSEYVLAKDGLANITEDRCLKNNRESCTIDSECCSKICNNAGFCWNVKNVTCSEWITNSKDCNGKCVIPSSKTVGEAYSCIWECNLFSEGKNGICEPNNIFWLTLILGVILVLPIAYFIFGKGNEVKLRNIEKKIKDIKEIKRKNQKELDEINEANVKRRIELENEKIKLDKEAEDLEKQKKIIEEESYSNYINKQLNKYKREYETTFYEIYYDKDKEYFMVRDKKTKKVISTLQRHIYKVKIEKSIEGMEIHHIDHDTFNNEFWNLIALKKEDHNKKYCRFIHSKIQKENWQSGIKELKEQLKMKNEDFPEHIRKHMKEEGML